MKVVTTRTPAEVSAIVRERRLALRMTQHDVPGVSSATVRKIENGTGETPRPSTIVGLTEAFGWPRDALDRLAAGEDPASFAVTGMQARSGIELPADLTPEELAEVARYARYLRDQRGI